MIKLRKAENGDIDTLSQWFPSGEEFLPWEEFHEFRGGISTF